MRPSTSRRTNLPGFRRRVKDTGQVSRAGPSPVRGLSNREGPQGDAAPAPKRVSKRAFALFAGVGALQGGDVELLHRQHRGCDTGDLPLVWVVERLLRSGDLFGYTSDATDGPDSSSCVLARVSV